MKILKSYLYEKIKRIVNLTDVVDIHTHLFPKEFGNLFLYGIDEILTYHYLISEYFTYEKNIKPEEFYNFDKKKQAELIWQKLFIEHTPISEATKGVVTILNTLGIDLKQKNLSKIREYFRTIDIDEYIDKIFKLTKIKYVIMTNNPFSKDEVKVWEKLSFFNDKRFKSSLRIDDLLFNFPAISREMDLSSSLIDEFDIKNLRKFLSYWIKKINPVYFICSFPPNFKYPDENDIRSKILDRIIFPILKEYSMPFVAMFGVLRNVNPKLNLAGDAAGKSDLNTILNFVKNNENIKFLMTFLHPNEIYETAVLARKFNNLMLFSCWWFTNIPYLINETLRIRIELLGTNFIAYHSDARVLEHLIYKWSNFKNILTEFLTDKYYSLLKSGWNINFEEIKKDISALLHNNFNNFISS